MSFFRPESHFSRLFFGILLSINVSGIRANAQLGAAERPTNIARCIDAVTNSEGSFNLIASDGTSVFFRVEKQTVAKKRFKAEAEELEVAGSEDLVTVEWFYHPFTPFSGTNGFRMGKKMYAFGTGGWKIHEGDSDNAYGYIFNNPWFKGLYKRYQNLGMPPFSIGIPLRVPKSKAVALDKMVRNNMGQGSPPFSILFNNCSHCAIGAFNEAEIGKFRGSAFEDFSSLFTTRSVMLQRFYPHDGGVIYPLSGTNLASVELMGLVPAAIYDRITLEEIVRDIHITGQNLIQSVYGKFKRFTGLHIPENWRIQRKDQEEMPH